MGLIPHSSSPLWDPALTIKTKELFNAFPQCKLAEDVQGSGEAAFGLPLAWAPGKGSIQRDLTLESSLPPLGSRQLRLSLSS